MQCWAGPLDGYEIEDDSVDEIALPYRQRDKMGVELVALYARDNDLLGNEVYRFQGDV